MKIMIDVFFIYLGQRYDFQSSYKNAIKETESLKYRLYV